MQKKLIKLRFQNGLTLNDFNREVFALEGLDKLYDFVESDTPDFIIFGPYGNDTPAAGDYIRVGYYCENFAPDMSICEWGFGIPHQKQIGHPNYQRIQWHGLNPNSLVKPADYNTTEIILQKKKFCNFLYSNQVPYREYFFKQLSKYKKVDAPGRSMNNMPGIDTIYQGDVWQRKRSFLSDYKFTIAFENYAYPGYQTEKLYDAMQANSIPVYCGDPLIGNVFNTASFVNVGDYADLTKPLTNWLAKISQADFTDIRPAFFNNPQQRIKRKVKALGRELKMDLLLTKKEIDHVIDRIIELDNDDKKYQSILQQPWFVNNVPPANVSSKSRWIEIFESKN